MPRLEIYEERQAPTEEPVRLRLVSVPGGGIGLIAVDANGRELTCGNILIITPDGKLYLQQCIDPGLGFKLNSAGMIELAP